MRSLIHRLRTGFPPASGEPTDEQLLEDFLTHCSSAESLAKVASEKDKKAAAAFVGLTNSCGSCHYGGARTMLK